MNKQKLLAKLTFTFFCVALIVGSSLMIVFNNPMGLLIELIALIILFIVLAWTS